VGVGGSVNRMNPAKFSRSEDIEDIPPAPTKFVWSSDVALYAQPLSVADVTRECK
jgi:hypothetical protein